MKFGFGHFRKFMLFGRAVYGFAILVPAPAEGYGHKFGQSVNKESNFDSVKGSERHPTDRFRAWAVKPFTAGFLN